MSLVWREKVETESVDEDKKTKCVILFSECSESEEKQLSKAFDECAEKAVTLLDSNVSNESMYLLFQWNIETSTLSIVITDEKKEKDSTHVVECSFPGLNNVMNTLRSQSEEEWHLKVEEQLSLIKFWIKDYLSTSSAFLQFSLIAALYTQSRSHCHLL